jgi:hypothetical protein
VLDTAAVVGLDLTLEVGSVTDVIEVTAAAPLMESASSTVGQFIESKSVAARSSAITRSIWTFTTAGSTKDRTRSM